MAGWAGCGNRGIGVVLHVCLGACSYPDLWLNMDGEITLALPYLVATQAFEHASNDPTVGNPNGEHVSTPK